MRWLSGVLVVLTASVNIAATQSAPSDSIAARLAAVSRVRVTTASSEGELSRPVLSGDSLRFAGARLRLRSSGRAIDQRAPIPWHDIVRLDVPGPSRAGRGAVIGGLIGAATGLVLGIASDGYLSGGEIVAASGIVGAVGAGVGALVGASSPRWETIHDRAAAR